MGIGFHAQHWVLKEGIQGQMCTSYSQCLGTEVTLRGAVTKVSLCYMRPLFRI